MRVLDEPWEFSDFVRLTDEADAGTLALHDGTVYPDEDGEPPPAGLVVDGGSLRWRPAPAPGDRPGERTTPRLRLVLERVVTTREGGVAVHEVSLRPLSAR